MSTDEDFSSSLAEGWQRFLSHVIEHSLSSGRRSPTDFLRHFPPGAIMNGLAEQPQLRAKIITIATGVRQRVAEKKSVGTCVEDLEIALAENETDAETVVTLIDPDDRVRYLDRGALWAFVTEGDFWTTKSSDATGYAVAQEHLAYILERALVEELITHADVVAGVTVERLARHLPREELAKVLASALETSGQKVGFSPRALMADVPPRALVEHVPMAHLWAQVVAPKIAVPHALGEPGQADASPASPPASPGDDGLAAATAFATSSPGAEASPEPAGSKRRGRPKSPPAE